MSIRTRSNAGLIDLFWASQFPYQRPLRIQIREEMQRRGMIPFDPPYAS